MKNPDYVFLWAKLAEIVREVSSDLPAVIDEPGDLRIETKSGRPFATVRIQRGQVGLYLFPIYYFPDILPTNLSIRRSGLSTLRFFEEDDGLISEVPKLMERCLTTVGHY